MDEYRFGEFTRRDAECYSGHRVTITTHPGDKTGEGNETFTNMLFVYPANYPFAMLGEKLPDGQFDPKVAVSLHEIKTIEETAA